MQEMPVPQSNQAVRSIGSKHQTGTTEEAIGGRQVQVIFAGVLVIERDLEIFAAGLSDGHMFSVESH